MRGGREHRRLGQAALALSALVLSSCSMMFPHTELAIAPEGATLDELGIGLLADGERWIDAMLWLMGLAAL
jgi:hypothetical protein